MKPILFFETTIMKNIILVILLFPIYIFSQNFVMTWQQCYGGSEDDWVSSIISHKEGYLFFGSTHSHDGDITNNNCDGVGHGASWLVYIDNTGEIIFDSCYCLRLSQYEKLLFLISKYYYKNFYK